MTSATRVPITPSRLITDLVDRGGATLAGFRRCDIGRYRVDVGSLTGDDVAIKITDMRGAKPTVARFRMRGAALLGVLPRAAVLRVVRPDDDEPQDRSWLAPSRPDAEPAPEPGSLTPTAMLTRTAGRLAGKRSDVRVGTRGLDVRLDVGLARVTAAGNAFRVLLPDGLPAPVLTMWFGRQPADWLAPGRADLLLAHLIEPLAGPFMPGWKGRAEAAWAASDACARTSSAAGLGVDSRPR